MWFCKNAYLTVQTSFKPLHTVVAINTVFEFPFIIQAVISILYTLATLWFICVLKAKSFCCLYISGGQIKISYVKKRWKGIKC